MSVHELLASLLTESDDRMRELKRAALRGGPQEKAQYWLELKRTTGKGKSPLIDILQMVAKGKRPTMRQLDKVKRRLRITPQFVQRLYAITRMAEILRELASNDDYMYFLANARMSGESASAVKRNLIKTAKALDKLPPNYSSSAAFAAFRVSGWGIDIAINFEQHHGREDEDFDFNQGGETSQTSPGRWKTVPGALRFFKLVDEFDSLRKHFIVNDVMLDPDMALPQWGHDTPISRKRKADHKGRWFYQ